MLTSTPSPTLVASQVVHDVQASHGAAVGAWRAQVIRG